MFAITKRQKDFLGALKSVMSTDEGKKLFKYLQEDYVLGPSVQSSVEQTYYCLGKRDVIVALINDSKLSPEDLEAVSTITTYEE